MASGEGCASNHELHALRDNFFVTDTVLNRADRALVVKDIGDLRNRDSGMDRLGRDNAVITPGQFLGIAGCVEASGEVCRSGKSQAALLDCVGVFFPHIVGPHFGFARIRKVRRKQASYRSATNYADLHLAL